MSDQKTVGRLLGLGKKTLPTMTEDDFNDEAVKQAFTITARMRQEITHWKARAEEAETKLTIEEGDNVRLRTEIDRLKQEHDREISALRYEHDRLLRATSQLEGMFNAAGKVILDAIDELKKDRAPEPTAQYAPKADAIRAFAKAIEPEIPSDGPIPHFLLKPAPEASDV